MTSTASNGDEGRAPRPYWIPQGVHFDDLPEELQTAIIGIINPAYQELVLSASPGLEQATGVTIVHLVWLELLDQIELGREFAARVQAPQGTATENSQEREKLIARLLRTVGAKAKQIQLLLRLHEFKAKWGAFPPAPDPLKGTFPPSA